MPEFDLVIIGGGIVGASAALAGVRKGARVAVVDAGLAGRATDAGAGIVSPVALDRGELRPEWTSVITECVGYYRSLLAELDAIDPAGAGSATFEQVGELVVAGDDPQEQAALDAVAERLSRPEGRRAHGITKPVQTIDGADLRRYWPELRGDLRGLYIAEVGRVVGSRLHDRLMTATRRRAQGARDGAAFELIPGAGMLDPLDSSPRVRVGHRVLDAGAVLLATGAWAGADLAGFGVYVDIRPIRGQLVHLRLDGQQTGMRPIVNTPGGGYLLGFDDRIVVGATHEDVGFDARVTAAGQHAVLSAALDLAPGLSAATVLETRVGLRPATTDGLPLIGAVAPAIHVATGLGAWGLTLGPLLGELAARHALGDPLPTRLDFLRPGRPLLKESA
ncbi:D-amino-acid dehydrogenase [Kribbella rubisoli]|uniref:D-amino-acid dehydrogenase n=1 Tax=Kribbella rubisoli TaxID=3075929 RepID=A0A4Q7X097_9ACTN|nr:FAD-dependent oxidoreductase [Kribbella rubisoli]RZU16274.1 D-amino-acid dehydrogenase [Kribbella rubisoli]